MWRWIVVGGLLAGIALVAYELRDDEDPSAHVAERRPPPAPTAKADPAQAPTPPKAAPSVAVDRLAWDLYFARQAEQRAAVAAQVFFPDLHARLVDDLTDDDFERTQGAIAAIRYLGGARAATFLPALARALADGRTTGAFYAALEEIGEAARDLAPVLAIKLEEAVAKAPRGVHSDSFRFIDVGTPASALGALNSRVGVPALRAAMLEPIERFPEDAIAAVAKLGPAASAARPELFELLRRRYLELDEGVSRALVATDPDGREILPRLREMAKEPRAPRAGIAQVFRHLGAVEETGRLAGWLDQEYGRREALDALAAFGPAARAAIPALQRLIETWKDDERAFVALAAIAPERVPALIETILARPPRLLDEDDLGLGEFEWDERPANLATLGRWGERARSALPRLVEHLQNPDIHPNTLGAAAEIDPAGESWTKTALAWLSHESWKRRSWAVDAFRRAKRFTPAVRDAVVPLLKDRLVRDEVADLLAEYEEVPVALVPLLLFQDPAALRALAHVPVIPCEHLEALVPLVGEHPHEGVYALARLDADGMQALRAFVTACAPRAAPPSPAAIARVLRKHGLTRDEARAALRTGLPDRRCAQALAWLE